MAPRHVQVNIKFFVVQVDSAYNAILDRAMLAALHVVTFVPYFKIKFLAPYGVSKVKEDLDIARRCYRHTLTSSIIGVSKQRQTMKIEVEPFTEGETKSLAPPVEETKDVELFLGNKEKTVKIRTRLGDPFRIGLIDLVRTYANVFAWRANVMPEIDESVKVHRLSVDPRQKPAHQKRQIFTFERQGYNR